ncbi:hypothetical protein B0J17DRAFT_652741 [Rhizoctonia solani]|nr:hypothetical protein B0J17DRAFT_652741 [Rhizoctonia solani]
MVDTRRHSLGSGGIIPRLLWGYKNQLGGQCHRTIPLLLVALTSIYTLRIIT